MPTINKLISQWRQWINRNRTFTSHEMDELENHLLEEIDDLKQYEGLSEEEAFQKVVSVMGGREALDKEFVKSKPLGPKAIHWVKTHNWYVTAILFAIIVVLVSDLIYSNTHFADVYEPRSSYFDYRSSNNNSYAFMVFFSRIKPANRTFTMVLDPSIDQSKISKTYKVIWRQITYSDPDPVKDLDSNKSSETSFPTETPFPKLNTFWMPNDPADDIWDTKSVHKMNTKPLQYCETNIFNANYQFVLDDKNQLWIEHYSKFTTNSPKVHLKTQSVDNNSSKFFNGVTGSDDGLESIFYPYRNYPNSYDATKFLFFQPINPYQVLLFQKETDRVRTVRLQLIQFPNQKNPILVWDEVKLVHKPIHLWNKLKLSRQEK